MKLTMGKPLMQRLKIARALGKSLKEFLSKTAVHSYHYLVEPNRHKVEKGMWIILHCIMSIAAIYIVLFAWSRFTDNPTITTLETQHHSIYNLDFPAVAICSNNKISRTYAENYADFL
jgi:acid-sensing ion channel, other